MIIYLYKIILKSGISPALVNKQIIHNIKYNLFYKTNVFDLHILNINFLLYSIAYFISWSKFVLKKQMYVWLITEFNSIFFLQNLISNHLFSYICGDAWIPGLLCNPHFVMKGERFFSALNKKKFEIKNWIQLAFFCYTKNILILQEMNYCIIPSIVPVVNIYSSSNFKDFIPLFLPKKKIKKLLFDDKIKITKIFMPFNTVILNNSKFQHVYNKQKQIINVLSTYKKTHIEKNVWLFYILLFNFYLEKKW